MTTVQARPITDYLTSSQVADRLGVHAQVVQRMANEGIIPSEHHPRLGRLFDPDEVERFASTYRRMKRHHKYRAPERKAP